MDILQRRYLIRRQGLSTGKTTLGHAIFHTVATRRDRSFNIYQLRLREIESIIRARHDDMVPDPAETDDRDTCLDYARAVAASLSTGNLHHWALRWMPWASEAEIDDIAKAAGWRKYMLSADQVASMLGVTLAERDLLGLRTVGACDVDKSERQVIAKAAKRARDRERKADARRAAGRVDRQTYVVASAEATKPWVDAGVSRRTWYRKRGGTSVSRIEIEDNIGDTPVPNVGDTPASESTDAVVGGARRAPDTPDIVAIHTHAAIPRDAGGEAAISPHPSRPNETLWAGASTAGPGPHRTGDIESEEAA